MTHTDTDTDTDTDTADARTAVPVRVRVADLSQDLDAGRWTPTPLEQRIAGSLLDGSAGDGDLTVARLQAAGWEGSLALTQDNGGRLGALLGDLLPVVGAPAADAPAVVAAVRELLARIAGK